MDETTIEECRWRAQRILKADSGVCEEWQRKAALYFLSNARPGRFPSDKVVSMFREAWSAYWTRPRNWDIPDDMNVLE